MATIDDTASVEMKYEEGSRRSSHPHVWFVSGACNKAALLSATVNIHLHLMMVLIASMERKKRRKQAKSTHFWAFPQVACARGSNTFPGHN
ncbi:hypothetical protein NC651_036786 [Populus alba x Populus x berolinensis]|nr:hypothetical protein NC651_036786 [Populus alba x Populus x berolinensis]